MPPPVNPFDQFVAQDTSAQAPIAATTLMGNPFDQFVPSDAHAASNSGTGIVSGLERLWNNPPTGPSLVGAIKSAVDAFKTPGEAMQGKFSAPAPQTPGMMSEQDAYRANLANQGEVPAALNMAANIALPSVGGVAVPAKASVPTADDLYAAGRQAYNSIKQLGVTIKPQPIADLAHSLENELTQNGFTDRNVPETYSVIRNLQTPPTAQPNAAGQVLKDRLNANGYTASSHPELHAFVDQIAPPTSPVITAQGLDSARQELLQAAKNQTNLREGPAAHTVINGLDNYLANIPPSDVLSGDAEAASNLFNVARGNWAAAKRADMIGGKLDLADLNAETAHSGQNSDNAVRQAIKQLIRPNNYATTLADMNGFSPHEIAQMNRVARGSSEGKALRVGGNLLGGGNAMGVVEGAMAYPHMGPAAVGIPVAGYALKKAGNAITGSAANTLDNMVRARSPLAQLIAAAQPQVVPTGRVSALAQLLAQNAVGRGTSSVPFSQTPAQQ